GLRLLFELRERIDDVAVQDRMGLVLAGALMLGRPVLRLGQRRQLPEPFLSPRGDSELVEERPRGAVLHLDSPPIPTRLSLFCEEGDLIAGLRRLRPEPEDPLVMEEEPLAVVGLDKPPALLVVELRDGAVQAARRLGDPHRLEPRRAVLVRPVGDRLVLDRL